MKGVLFLVVGSSGAGKDSLLDGARERLGEDPRFKFATRIITRATDGNGEVHEAITEEKFAARLAAGEFFIHWQAHGLNYALPETVKDALNTGRHVLVNISRNAISEAVARHEDVRVIEITAKQEVLAARLIARGRESRADVARRLKRKTAPIPANLQTLTIENNALLEDGIERFVDAVIRSIPGRLKLRRIAIDTWRDYICFLHRDCATYPASDYLGPNKVDIFTGTEEIRARVNVVDDEQTIGRDEVGLSSHAFDALGLPEGTEVMLERASPPDSLSMLRSKVAGGELDVNQMRDVIRDIVDYRYTEREIIAFLVAASKELTLGEIQALTRARAEYAHRFEWSRDMVVDKHSMGGVPGSRISMIVIPIVAAHGLWIPKTSSRAITSAAGTADAMECVAKVDLTPDVLREVVEKAGGCIAWNGKISHSPVDDVMNSITRSLGIDSTKLAVTSILSKKIAAGSSHVVIDIPFGIGTKVENESDAMELASLFEIVGAGVGLFVAAVPTDASRPVGRGIGPALEVRDVWSVLSNAPDAPSDLREKALDFAGIILNWDGDLSDGCGRERARDLLESGAALERMELIVDLQGRKDKPIGPGALAYDVLAMRSGEVTGIDNYQISSIARQAGAPMDKGAGIDLLATVGTVIESGASLYRIHGNIETDFRLAVRLAVHRSGFEIK